MLKTAIRKEYKGLRAQLSHSDILKKTDLLLIQFQKLGFENIHTILSYQPISQQNEIDVENLVRYLQMQFPELNVCYPKSNFSDNSMEAILEEEESEFQLNDYFIPEITTGKIIAPEEIDLIFVPLLAFDTEGFRVGYGKGFYDRFIQKCREDVLKIGVSFFAPVDQIDDRNSNDIPLDFCITPEDIYAFQ
ncbi:5-formyltetrahydrofolate cyclo-ligase [Rhizosphaericola mali]|uniref:5-formyltetrahydrofolate cyclo-ligase n=1 Tax=Rhizosphaericola mali TaxID=2545455 RepID=A0A5P2G2X4_9BACT|nr:5-formyltetrahydrofolate cyclo-ligase [Rhizosphaericola mali]QES87463.1 5-formyltetrahydrofolate cyclo-ligase [Rhizosphaericola mali]